MTAAASPSSSTAKAGTARNKRPPTSHATTSTSSIHHHPPNPPLKVLFLSSDTGGGHRASAESLARQFELHHPGSTYHLLDALTDCAPPSLLPGGPSFTIESAYKHLSAHPVQWRIVYHATNTRTVRSISTVGLNLTTEHYVRRTIQDLNPDVVISVHPMMNAVPSLACSRISAETNRHLPFFTVVTDLGSGHDTWFAGKRYAENIFLASDALVELATRRGRVPGNKIVRSGLPIRHEFGEQAKLLGPRRRSLGGGQYRRLVRERLGLAAAPRDQPPQQQQQLELQQIRQYQHEQAPNEDEKVILLMGGGEGVGSLSSLVDSLYVELTSRSMTATIVVICGRNETLRHSLEVKDWTKLDRKGWVRRERRRKTRAVARTVRRMLSSVSCPSDEEEEEMKKEEDQTEERNKMTEEKMGGMDGALEMKRGGSSGSNSREEAVPSVSSFSSLSSIDVDEKREEEEADVEGHDVVVSPPTTDDDGGNHRHPPRRHARVRVHPLGFVTQMAEHMVASDVLITKAGPGTIAEAAAVGLPVLLTSYLPGQEEGNVDFVVDNEFGAYVSDGDPEGVARTCCGWLRDEDLTERMSERASAAGVPNAAEDIAKFIGKSVSRWMELNEEHAASSSDAAAGVDSARGGEACGGESGMTEAQGEEEEKWEGTTSRKVMEVTTTRLTTKASISRGSSSSSSVVVRTEGKFQTSSTSGPKLESPISVAAGCLSPSSFVH